MDDLSREARIAMLRHHRKSAFKENMKIVFDEVLPKWNYRAIPSGS